MKKLTGKLVLKASEKGRYTIQATTDDIDRQGDRVIPSGVTNLEQFVKYGSILYGHDWSGLPIAKPVSGKASDQVLLLEIEFADTPMGQEVKYLYDEGFLSSFSIGFLPDVEKIDIIDGVRTFKAWELLEVSAVPVPANAGATILREAALRRGVPLAAMAKMLDGQEEPAGEVREPGNGTADGTDAANRGTSGIAEMAGRYQTRSKLWTS